MRAVGPTRVAMATRTWPPPPTWCKPRSFLLAALVLVAAALSAARAQSAATAAAAASAALPPAPLANYEVRLLDRGDDAALAALIARCRAEPGFFDRLRAHCEALAPRFQPALERRAVRRHAHTLLAESSRTS